MSTTRKKQMFKAMIFRTIKIAKFCCSEIKWVYSILTFTEYYLGETIL